MNAGSALVNVLKRDRLIVLAGVVAITVLAWGYMIHEARAMSLTGACCCAGMKMSGPDVHPWSVASLLPLFLMWAEMMVAMMLPSAAPMILTFASVNRQRQERQAPFVPTAVFVAGYFLVWTGVSALAALAQWALHAAALLSPTMVSTSPFLGGALLVIAGLFQWTPLKNSCLAKCRSPLNFLLTEWRDGKMGAFGMGFKHGIYCTGCCWFLMLLLFVAGVMNMWWVAAIAVLVLVEKAGPRETWVSKGIGLLFVVWGSVLLIGAGRSPILDSPDFGSLISPPRSPLFVERELAISELK